jgi:hypothetical protein
MICLRSLRNSVTYPHFALVAVLIGAPGCITGVIRDAATHAPIEGATVVIEGKCTGSGCQSSSMASTTSDSDGNYVFDAYGDLKGSDQVQGLDLADGRETMTVTISKPGYEDTTLYFRPSYETVTSDDGKSYDVAHVQDVYLCPSTSADSDSDGLCDDAEVAYGSKPDSEDGDRDGFSDRAEIMGFDQIDLKFLGASPTKRDVFVYVDYYVPPIADGLTQVEQAFARAPSDGQGGNLGIALHVMQGQQIAAADQNPDLIGIKAGNWSQYDKIKNVYFPERYASIAHYALFANVLDSSDSSGWSRGIPGHDLVVTLGAWGGGTQLEQAGTFMHELGHLLGLQHGGDEGANCKPNYVSIMSYAYQVVGLFMDGQDGVLDYSRLQLGRVSETQLNEANGMTPTGSTQDSELAHYGAKFPRNGVCTSGSLVEGTLDGWLDFNGNHQRDGSVRVDLNANSLILDSFRPSQNDWVKLIHTGAVNGGGTIGDIVMAQSIDQIVPPDQMPPELERP